MTRPGDAYQPVPHTHIAPMLALLALSPRDVVLELGSGDGRICIAAATLHGASVIGVERDGELVRKSRDRIAALGLADRVQIEHGDLWDADWSRATAVTAYGSVGFCAAVADEFRARRLSGTRLVAYDQNDAVLVP